MVAEAAYPSRSWLAVHEQVLLRGRPMDHGLQYGLAHGLAAKRIAGTAWNGREDVMLDLGDGAVRFQRFRYLWIWQAGVVAMSGRNTVVLKLPAGEYFQRFGVAMARLATL